MQREFRSAERATMGSLNSFAGSIFFGVLAYLLGFAADRVSPARALMGLQIIQFVNLYFYWKLFKHDRQPIINS